MTKRRTAVPFRRPLRMTRALRRCALTMLSLMAATASNAAAQEVLPIESALTRQVQETVLARSAFTASARAAVEAARARADAAGLPPAAVLSSEIEDVPDGYDLASAAIRVEFGREFMTGGRTAAARALALTNVDLATARLAALERSLRADVLRELTRLVAADAIARRLAAEDTLLLGAEASLRDRFSVGEARYVDVLRLRAERLRVQTDRAAVLADVLRAREALAGLADVSAREEILALADSAVGMESSIAVAALPPAPSIDSLNRAVSTRRARER